MKGAALSIERTREALGRWWSQLSVREQRLVRAALALAAALVLWQGIYRPLWAWRARMQQAYAQAAQQAEEAERLAAQAKKGAKPQASSLLALIEEHVGKAHLREHLVRIRPVPAEEGRTRMSLAFQDAPYPALVRFLGAIGEAGAELISARWERAGQPGFVHARLVLEYRR